MMMGSSSCEVCIASSDSIQSLQVQKGPCNLTTAICQCASQTTNLFNKVAHVNNGQSATHRSEQTRNPCNEAAKTEDDCGVSSKIAVEGYSNIVTNAGSGANITIMSHIPIAATKTEEHSTTSQPMVVPTGLPHAHYNEAVLWCVTEKLTESQLRKMKILVHRDVTTGLGPSREELQKIKNTEDFLYCLEDNRLLSVNNTWFLQYLIYRVGNKEVYKGILDFMVQRMTSEPVLCVYEPHELDIKGDAKANVQLKVAGDINHFGTMDVERFRQLLADNCGNKVIYTNLNGINNGCVKLFFQMPTRGKDQLLTDARKHANWLIQNGVLQVTIEGEEPILLPEGEMQEPSMAKKAVELLKRILKHEMCKDFDVQNLQKEVVNASFGGKPMLHWATELNKKYWVNFLFSKGVDVNAVDEAGCTAIHMAAFLGFPNICSMLLRHADIDYNAVDEDGQTALDIAKHANFTEIITLFENPALDVSEHHSSEDIKPASCDSGSQVMSFNDNTNSAKLEKLQKRDEKKRKKKEKCGQMKATKGQNEKGSTEKKWWQIYRASSRYNSKTIGLSAQKKILAKIGSRSNAKTFINDNMAEMLDNVYHLCKGYTKSKEEAEKIMKNIIKVTIKVGVLFQNGQFNQQELVLADIFTKELRVTILTFVFFYEVDFTFDNDHLAKRINDCCSLLTQLVGRHLTKKSTDRIRAVFKFFSDDSFLNGFLETLFKTDCPLQKQLDNVVGGLNRLIESGDI